MAPAAICFRVGTRLTGYRFLINGTSHSEAGYMQRVDARGAFSLCLCIHPEESGSIPDPPRHRGGIALTLREYSARVSRGALSGKTLREASPAIIGEWRW